MVLKTGRSWPSLHGPGGQSRLIASHSAAVSALSARLLASLDAASLAILGTGTQAEAHARLVTRVRPIRSVWIAGRDHDKARLLAQRLDAELEPDVRPARSYEAAVAGSQIVCATTFASEPVVRRDWLERGTHVTRSGTTPTVESWTTRRSWTRCCALSLERQRCRPSRQIATCPSRSAVGSSRSTVLPWNSVSSSMAPTPDARAQIS